MIALLEIPLYQHLTGLIVSLILLIYLDINIIII